MNNRRKLIVGLGAGALAAPFDAFAKMAASDEWKKPLPNDVGRVFLRSRDFAKFLASEYQISKTVLTDLGYGL